MLVLDTCALIWLVNNDPMRPASIQRIGEAGRSGVVIVPAVTRFEIGILARKGRIVLEGGLEAWLERAATLPGSRIEPLTGDMALDAARLPEPIHNDPADRFVIATARAYQAAVVTRDRAILAYGRTGNVRVLRC